MTNSARNFTIPDYGPARIVHEDESTSAFIVNTGTTTVYLGTDAGVTQTSGMPLGPANTKVWEAGVDCYAVGTGTVNVSYNPGALTNPVAIGNAILDAGLANAIAQAIYVTGAPPVDKYTQLDDSGSFTAGYTSAVLDVSAYQSLQIRPVQGLPVSYLVVSVQWRDAAGAVILGSDSMIMGGGQAGAAQTFDVPVRGATAIISATDTFGSGGGTIGFRIRTFASYKEIDKVSYYAYGAGSADGTIDAQGTNLGFKTWSGSIPLATTWLWEPDVRAGKAVLTIRYTTSTTSSLIVRLPTTIYPLTIYAGDPGLVTSGSLTKMYDLLLPAAPLEISLANSGAAVLTFRATLVYETPYT